MVGLEPKILLALRTSIKQNAHYISEHEILYPAGSTLLLHNYPKKQQRYIQLMEKSIHLEMIIVSPSRTMAAFIINDEKGHIVIYDLKNLKKKKTLHLPHDATTKRFQHMCFSFDEKLLLTLTGEPDWVMLSYNWEKGKVETFTRANYINNPGPVSQVLCSPTDSAVCCLLGPGLFRLMSMQETVWRQYGFQKADQVNVTTAAFLGSDRVLVGTEDGRLLLVDNGELKAVYNADTVDLIEVIEKEEGATTQPVMIPKLTTAKTEEDIQVRSLIAFDKGFAYSCKSGKVHMFEREDKNHYRRRNLYVIQDPDYREVQDVPLNIVQHLSIDPVMEKLLATTNRSQIYWVPLWGPSIPTVPEVSFKHVGQSLHHGAIADLDVSTWKPLFMTCGAEDRTVRLWNSETGALEMLKQYEEQVLSIALHPTALFAAIGLIDKLRYMMILLDDMKPCTTLPLPGCRLLSFCNSGSYLAAVHKFNIIIYNTISFEAVWTFKGHSGKVTSLSWTPNDLKLASCGEEGSVYEWNMTTGTRVGETVDKAVRYWECAITAEGKFVYAVGNDGQLKEISDSNVLRNFGFGEKDVPHIVLSRSNQMIFICGEAGLILSLKVPLIEPISHKSFLYHNSKILKMKLTYDDLTLITVSETGTLCIWDVVEAEGKHIELSKHFAYCTDVLIPKNDLQNKVATIFELSQRMKELVMEQEYRIRQTEITHNAAIKQIHESYGQTIQDLKAKIVKSENEHERIEKNQKSEIVALRKINEDVKQDMEAKYNSKLIVEYDKYSAAQRENEATVQEYEKKLVQLGETKDQELKTISGQYLEQINNLQSTIDKLQKENEQEKMEHEEIKQQIEDDADREIIELKAKYVQILKDERDINVKLRSEEGVMRKKLANALKENDKYRLDIAMLHNDQLKSSENIQSLQQDINELKREVYERDLTIQDKEKSIYDMKKNIEELEKYKFVLGHKIEELKNKLEPKQRQLEDKEKQIENMELEMEAMQETSQNTEVTITELRNKQLATDQELRKFRIKCESLANTVKTMSLDILQVTDHLQDPKLLKLGVKKLHDKHSQGKDIANSHTARLDLEAELLRQKESLEQTVITLKSALSRTQRKPADNSTIIKENIMFIEEINDLRKKVRGQEEKITKYETIVLNASGKINSVEEVKKNIERVLCSRDEINQDLTQKLRKAENEILMLQEQLEVLKHQ